MKTQELFKSKDKCCGCGVCAVSCPKQCIYMKEDKNGFIYPNIDEAECINCGRCVINCNFQNVKKEQSIKETYVAVSDDTDVSQSASGGIFASYAQSILNQGGIVYGCAMIESNGILYPRHIVIKDTKDLYLLQGSKYVQSDMDGVYQDVKMRLEKENLVLFSGTPCQVAALKAFLKKEYKNFYTLDIICHGVPSVKLFQDYINFCEKKLRGKVKDFRFRDKSKGWKLYGRIILEGFSGNSRKLFFEPEKSSYYQMFLDMYTYRESCYKCPYASDNRQGDITIGDYWCVELVHPELINYHKNLLEKGVSCMIINNTKGKELLQKFGYGIRKFNSTYEKASKYNAQLCEPSELKLEREKVFRKYSKGYATLERWYRRKSFPIQVRRKIIRCMPQAIKKIIKRVFHRG